MAAEMCTLLDGSINRAGSAAAADGSKLSDEEDERQQRQLEQLTITHFDGRADQVRSWRVGTSAGDTAHGDRRTDKAIDGDRAAD